MKVRLQTHTHTNMCIINCDIKSFLHIHFLIMVKKTWKPLTYKMRLSDLSNAIFCVFQNENLKKQNTMGEMLAINSTRVKISE